MLNAKTVWVAQGWRAVSPNESNGLVSAVT